ncbi:hypothetical protein AK812_SmicGene10163 [Symbiodinium microadriaticum]|uniref:Uncharacterized protein n=1 Tax=Symbiodinium microadriaticum TaxID=2951 RepID=A0A1Q9EGG9_SYMMI|nr:hypothetical protein AK812_SmicGene10163 [Symbiodinium microadriaticum]
MGAEALEADLIARYQGSIGPRPAQRCGVVMRMAAADGSAYEADVLEVYTGILDGIRSYAHRPEEVTKDIMDRWETQHKNLATAIEDFKKDCEMHPYTKEGHLAKLQLDDLEAQMRQLLDELAEKAGIR